MRFDAALSRFREDSELTAFNRIDTHSYCKAAYPMTTLTLYGLKARQDADQPTISGPTWKTILDLK